MSPRPGAGERAASAAGEDVEDLYEHAPCGYLSTSLDGRIIKVNQTFLDWTGYRREELLHVTRFPDLLTAGGRIYHETHYAPLLRMQGTVREIALDLVRADGETMPVLVTSVLRTDSSGEPVAVRTAVFGASDRRQYERELLRARREAEESEARARLLAQTLQQSLIPPGLPRVPGVDVGAVYRPAGQGHEVGGDFYDVFETAEDDWAIVLGDVCGKGAAAATVTALARYTTRAAAMRSRLPSDVLSTLNQALLDQRTDRFCTVVYARVRQAPDGPCQLTLASGGHPLPVRVSREGDPEAIGRPGSLLGVLDEPDLHDEVVDLQPGDVVVFYSDGVPEARHDDTFYGDARLAALVAACRGDGAPVIAQRILEEVVDFQGGLPRDDIAVVVLKMPSTG